MMERPFYHDGMRALQDRFDGRRTADALEKHRKHYAFWDEERAMIEGASFFFIGSATGEYVDCNVKSGDPGFVKVVGPATVEFPEYDGNSMYRTAGNIIRNPNIGLLFLRFDGASRRIRINGRAILLDDPETLSRHYGAKFVIRVDCEIYPNCPRYLPDLERGLPSPHPPRLGTTAPTPEWQSWDYIRDGLPSNDSHRT